LNSLREDSLLPCQIWVSSCSKWSNGDVSGGNLCDTYRVNAKEHPVGSLKPIVDLSRERIEIDIEKDLHNPEILPIFNPFSVVEAVKAGKIKHLEIKYG